MTTRILTGITTTGTPHLGNYAGAIRPAIVASRDPQADSFYFLADYHALIKCDDPARIQRSRLEIAATWLALGLDTDKARTVLSRDALWEPAYRSMMLIHHRMGNPGSVLQIFHQCQQTLNREIGSGVSAETQALLNELLGRT